MRSVSDSKAFRVAAIGASAGGLKAFAELLGGLPPEPGSAFVLVPHLAPQFKSHLTEILARSTKLPVSEVRSGDKVAPNRIYVIPPNRAMLIKGGVLRLSSSGPKSDRHNPIDAFFASLADDQGKGAVGVLLSGEGSDGTEGLRAIKERGGTTYAQDAGSADHASMPQSAVFSGHADFILSASEIGRRLGAAPAGDDRWRRVTKADELFNEILGLLRAKKGVDFTLYKRNMLHRRIQRRMALGRVRDAEKYFRALRTDPRELELLYRDILISVTSFFREPESFAVLKNTVYARLLKNKPSHAPIRIWVPGCSTGEEAYSHAINLAEFLGKRAALTPFHIFATDVNPAVIEQARSGVYAKNIKEVSSERLRRFFVKTKDGYSIAPAIRERCTFAAQNLVQDPPFTNLDLISCRNLLIYLGPTFQERAFQIFQYALKPGGVLMLGRSETIGAASERFSTLNLKRKVFFARTAVSKERLDFLQAGRFLEAEAGLNDLKPGASGKGDRAADAVDLQAELDAALPARYVPNGVLVNGGLDILRFLGNTSAYLRPAPGRPELNLRRMASGELLMELRVAIHVAKKSSCVVRKEVAAPHSNGSARRLNIEVLPVKASPLHEDYFLVLFEEVSPAEPGRRRRAAKPGGKDSRRVVALEEDLAASGGHLKAIIEEQEATNARLKVSSEALLTSNEELQSINEEFETAKEELQSTNEELVSSTDEVGRGNLVLSRANNDLSNLLANINIPIVLLDPDLTIHRFTPSAEAVLGLSADEVGRSVVDIRLPLRLPNLKQLLLDVIRDGRVQKLEVQDLQGRWYYLFLRPYRTAKSRTEKSKTEGAVLALVDIHDRKLAEKTVLRLATVVLDSNDAVIICDLKDRVTAWNKGAQKMYGYTEAEALGMSIRRLMPKAKRVRARDLAQVSAAPIETQRRTKAGRILDVLLTVTVLRDEQGRPTEVAATERDITEQKRAGREFRLLHARVISAQETERKRLARELHDGVGQILSGVKFRLDSLPGTIGLDAKSGAKILKVGGFLDHAIAEVRRVSQNLMPSELVDLGLEPALRTLCREFKQRAGLHVTLRVERVPPVVSPELALAFFRIAQEALNNIGKHSKADMVTIALSRKRKDIVLVVSDNGVGFVPGDKRAPAGRGIGLGNMRERADSVGGSIDVHSTLGAGTTLSVRAPLLGLGGGPL